MNQDYSQRVAYRLDALSWEPSPAKGVWRKKLERQAAESGRATSLVRYDPGSSFATHTHDGGEEILVLEGTFSDETGDYPQGCYFRNPPGTSHAPSSVTGCVLFVKLCHFSPNDNVQVTTIIADKQWQPKAGNASQLLHHVNHESTSVVCLNAGESLPRDSLKRGREILVINGSVVVDDETYSAYSWLRFPAAQQVSVSALSEGTLLLLKQGHFSNLESA